MEHTFRAAMEHIHLMESRIAQQQRTIQRLRQTGQDTSEGISRLKLLHAALEEMRIQLARLVPTEEQIAAPMWARRLVNTRAA
jgi:hypothetical protein